MTPGKGKGRKAAIMPQGKGKATAVQRVIMTPGKGKTTAAMPVTTTQGKGKAAAAPDKAAVASLLAAARALPVTPSLQVVMSPKVQVPMPVVIQRGATPVKILFRLRLQKICPRRSPTLICKGKG
jgi:hypothetical protein